MRMPDVNVLLYALDRGCKRHAYGMRVLDELRSSAEPLGLVPLILSSVVRLSINRHAMSAPASSTQPALDFCGELLNSRNAVVVNPGKRHWDIFKSLCGKRALTVDLVPDAYLASIAIEADGEMNTFDSDFAYFAGLRWRYFPSGRAITNPG